MRLQKKNRSRGHKETSKPQKDSECGDGRPQLLPNVEPVINDGHIRHDWKPDSTPRWRMALEILTLIGVGLAAWAGYVQAGQSIRSADAAKDSIEAAQKQFNTSQRPWISVKTEVNGPITWDDGRMQVRVRYTLSNTGNSPALKVKISAEPFFDLKGTGGAGPEKERFCEQESSPALVGVGDAVFPGEHTQEEWTINAGGDQVAFEAVRTPPYHPFSIITCVSYSSSYDNVRHYSGYAVSVWPIDKVTGRIVPLLTGMGVPASEISLSPEFHGVIAK